MASIMGPLSGLDSCGFGICSLKRFETKTESESIGLQGTYVIVQSSAGLLETAGAQALACQIRSNFGEFGYLL
jgi:hypothetical protein